MQLLSFTFQVAALALLTVAALGLFPSRVAWGWAGMFLWLLSLMTSGIALHQIH